MTPLPSPPSIWHDVECGGYTTDLELWRRLASEAGGPVLDVGAGTGRVALDLARRGHSVTALDCDTELLDELARRARALRRGDGQPLDLEVAVADARDFALGSTFPLIIGPMQTIQLLGGAEGRARFLRRARDHLAARGRLALALTEQFDFYETPDGRFGLPSPDVRQVGGTVYRSYPVAVRRERETILLERLREATGADGREVVEHNLVQLDPLKAVDLEAEGRLAGLRLGARLEVPATREHVGSVVVTFDV